MKTTKGAAPLAAFTHREAFDHFPILKKPMSGFDGSGRITDPALALEAAYTHGGGAHVCAKFVLSLAGFPMPEKQTFNLYMLLSRVDKTHKRAALRLFRAVAERGIK